MLFNTSEDLATYHAALRLPKSLVCEFTHLTDKWVRCNGVDWTVARMKILYTDFVRFRAGQTLVGSWYAKNKTGLPSGVLNRIFNLGLTKKHRFGCSTLLRSYTRYIRSEPSSIQLKKFLDGVQADDVVIPDHIKSGVVLAANSVIGKMIAIHHQPSYLSYCPSPGKRVPLSSGRTAPEETHWPTQWETIENTKTGRYLRNKYPDIFTQVFSGFNTMTRGQLDFVPTGIDAVGKIGLIQEPGLKLRAVANPNRIYQVALKPLGDAIYDILSELPWDCTHHQAKAFPVIQQHLQTKQRCHCIDLSGATDYFPLSLQLEVLRSIFVNSGQYIDLFEDISKSNWIFQDTTIKWTKGQPLGLYPSFGSFALTHGLLLYYLNDCTFSNDFYVLGDDVVILDDGLASKYLKCLDELKCPKSDSKSITSKVMAEFGGKLIFADHVEPQLKWRQLSDDNFVDIVKLLGRYSLRLLRPKQRKVVKAIWDLPDFVGGIGFNPKGIPLADRYEKYLSLFGDDESTYLMSYDRKLNSFFMNEEKPTSNKSLSMFWNEDKLPDLDQRSAALVSKYLPLFNKWYGIMGTNLYSVSTENRGILPIDGVTGKRSTLLSTLQRKLGM